jgi:hypothetical protein
MRTHPHYAIQAVLVYVAIGIALGMVGWALLIHDGGGGATAGIPAQKAPHTGSHR